MVHLRARVLGPKVLGPTVLGPLVLAAMALGVLRPQAALSIEILSPSGGLPPSIVGQMREPEAFVETSDGRFLVYDSRAQTVFSIDAGKKTLKALMRIGPSDGELLQPTSFAVGPDRTFSVLDLPGDYERVQTFYDDGTPIGVVRRWPEAGAPARFALGPVTYNGIGDITAAGRGWLVQLPNTDALFTQLDAAGAVVRHIGRMRATGHERDALLHRALNAGLALAAPDGGYYFVFTTGVPQFRRYDAAGSLLFERHIEGPELDAILQTLPAVWPTRRAQNREFPIMTATIRTAALDPSGALWISLGVPFTYVYDPDGNKTRTLQFRGAGVIAATSLFFAKGGRVLVTPGCYEYKLRNDGMTE